MNLNLYISFDGFKDELKKQEVPSKSLYGLAIGFGIGLCGTSLGVGIVATFPAVVIIVGTAVTIASVGAGMGYVVGEFNNLQPSSEVEKSSVKEAQNTLCIAK